MPVALPQRPGIRRSLRFSTATPGDLAARGVLSSVAEPFAATWTGMGWIAAPRGGSGASAATWRVPGGRRPLRPEETGNELEAVRRGGFGPTGAARGLPPRTGGFPHGAGDPSSRRAGAPRGRAREGAQKPGFLPGGLRGRGGSRPPAPEARSAHRGDASGLRPPDDQPVAPAGRREPGPRRALRSDRRG